MCAGPAGSRLYHVSCIIIPSEPRASEAVALGADRQPDLPSVPSLLDSGSMKTERLLPLLQSPPAAVQTLLTLLNVPQILLASCSGLAPCSGQDLKQL